MKKKIVGLVLCSILFIYFIGGIVYNFVFENDNDINQINSVTIKDFDYILYEDEMDIYKEEFKKLKNNLESEEINYLEYAYSISKMFIIDVYSLDNKMNKYDVGGVNFIYPEARDNFRLNLENTLYKYIKDNSDGKREQELPVVKNVNIIADEKINFTIGDTNYDAYKISVNIDYVNDLGYDNKAELVLIKDNKYLYIAEKN